MTTYIDAILRFDKLEEAKTDVAAYLRVLELAREYRPDCLNADHIRRHEDLIVEARAMAHRARERAERLGK